MFKIGIVKPRAHSVYAKLPGRIRSKMRIQSDDESISALLVKTIARDKGCRIQSSPRPCPMCGAVVSSNQPYADVIKKAV